MQIATTIPELRELLAHARYPAFVPTMGNLHEGHLALVNKARAVGDVSVASTFVNRLQFLPHEDIGTYPRTWEIGHMVRQFALPIEVLGAETERAAGGLAPSSRNAYLVKQERIEAARLSRTLGAVARAVQEGERDFAAMEARATAELAVCGWQPDYVALRRRSDLSPPQSGDPLVVLAAARLGTTRLIDNVEIGL